MISHRTKTARSSLVILMVIGLTLASYNPDRFGPTSPEVFLFGFETMNKTTRLHLGCGKFPLEGWTNLDRTSGPGVDVTADLDACTSQPLPFDDDGFDEILGSHVIEHIQNTLSMMQELHRVSKAGARAVFKTPYGSSDDAFEDPTHVRSYFINSWGYFAQPFYWRADYGYRGDWQPEKIILVVRKDKYQGRKMSEIVQDIHVLRNVVLEMTAELRCVKPRRDAKRELQTPPEIMARLA